MQLQIKAKHTRILFVTDSSNPIIKDIEWALHSAPLPVPQNLQPWVWTLAQTDVLHHTMQYDITTQLVRQRHQRLGRYFEALYQTGLSQHPDWHVVLSGFVIRDTTRTLGELDLVVAETQTQQLTHLELALKFYLRVDRPQCGHSHHWVGPSLVDSYEQKLDRLTQHQMPMGLHDQVRAELGQTIDAQGLVMKGRLFVSAQSDPMNHNHGIWLTHAQLQRQFAQCECLVLDRSQWLSGPAHRKWQPVRFWQPKNNPTMIWIRGKELQQQRWVMVVPPDWESRAKTCCPQQQLDF